MRIEVNVDNTHSKEYDPGFTFTADYVPCNGDTIKNNGKTYKVCSREFNLDKGSVILKVKED